MSGIASGRGASIRALNVRVGMFLGPRSAGIVSGRRQQPVMIIDAQVFAAIK